MYVYRDTVTVSFCFCFSGFIFKDWVYSLVAEPPLSKWEGQGSTPSTKKRKKERGGRRKGEGRKGGKGEDFYFQDLQILSQKIVGHISKKVFSRHTDHRISFSLQKFE